MAELRHCRAILAALLAYGGCQSQPHTQRQQTRNAPAVNETVPAGVTASSKEAEAKPKPQMFGFSVTNISVELCCSDTPGKPTPTGSTSVEGLTPDHVRFLLSCFPLSFEDLKKATSTAKISSATRSRWYEMHTASIEHEKDRDRMLIYNFDGKPPDYWKEFASCSILGQLDRAQNEFPILVVSSNAGDWKDGSGYQVSANSRTETFALRCIQNIQFPCVSVAPDTYRGIRDGSELRLCEQDLTVISTFQIVGERSLR